MIYWAIETVPSGQTEHEAACRLRDRMLAELCGIAQPQIHIQPGGKPVLADRTDVFFSVSHSHNVVLCAVSCANVVSADIERIDNGMEAIEIGADIERIPDSLESERLRRIAARFFPREEAEKIACLSDAEYPAAFCRVWTRCEAYGKRTGEGLIAGFGKICLPTVHFVERVVFQNGQKYCACVSFTE